MAGPSADEASLRVLGPARSEPLGVGLHADMVDPPAMRFRNSYWLLPCLVWCAQGCEKEQHEKSAEPVASVDKTAGIDPALAKAVAAASAMAGRNAAPAGSGGPPPAGIFDPGAADAEIKKGAPPKITLGGTGSEPRVALGPLQPKPGFKTQGVVQLSVQGDPQQGPVPVQLAITVEALKPKSAPTDAGPPAPVTMSVKVVGAKLGITGVPPEMEARFTKLKGSKLEYQVSPDGAGSAYKTEIAAGAESARDQLRQLTDVLALITLPTPPQPLGAGAFWMTTSREGVLGLDLVTYRMIKVEAVTGDLVTLSVGTKRYATSNRFDLDGLPPDAPHDLAEFECKSTAKVLLKVGTPFPQSGEVDSLLGASLLIPGQQGQQAQRGTLQIQSHASLDFGKH